MRVPEILSAVTTPFLPDGDIDAPGLRQNLERLEPLVDGVFVAGTTGEFPALEPGEHARVVEIALAVFGPERIVVHVGAPSTRQAIALARQAQVLGVRRAAALTPYYLPATAPGVIRHWTAIVDAFAGEVYGYVFPDVALTDLLPEDLPAAVEAGVVGLKVSGRASQRVPEYLQRAPDGFRLWSGNDADLPRVLAAGGWGTVSGVSSVCPHPWARLREALGSGDDGAASAAQQVIEEIVPVLGPSIANLKEGLDLLGLAGGPCRMTIDPPTPTHRTRIADAVRLGAD